MSERVEGLRRSAHTIRRRACSCVFSLAPGGRWRAVATLRGGRGRLEWCLFIASVQGSDRFGWLAWGRHFLREGGSGEAAHVMVETRTRTHAGWRKEVGEGEGVNRVLLSTMRAFFFRISRGHRHRHITCRRQKWAAPFLSSFFSSSIRSFSLPRSPSHLCIGLVGEKPHKHALLLASLRNGAVQIHDG